MYFKPIKSDVLLKILPISNQAGIAGIKPSPSEAITAEIVEIGAQVKNPDLRPGVKALIPNLSPLPSANNLLLLPEKEIIGVIDENQADQ